MCTQWWLTELIRPHFGIKDCNRAQSYLQGIWATYRICEGGERQHLKLHTSPGSRSVVHPNNKEDFDASNGDIQQWFTRFTALEGYPQVHYGSECTEGECVGTASYYHTVLSLPVILVIELDNDSPRSRDWSFPSILSAVSSQDEQDEPDRIHYDLYARVFHSAEDSHYNGRFTLPFGNSCGDNTVWSYDGMSNGGWCTRLANGDAARDLNGSDNGMESLPDCSRTSHALYILRGARKTQLKFLVDRTASLEKLHGIQVNHPTVEPLSLDTMPTFTSTRLGFEPVSPEDRPWSSNPYRKDRMHFISVAQAQHGNIDNIEGSHSEEDFSPESEEGMGDEPADENPDADRRSPPAVMQVLRVEERTITPRSRPQVSRDLYSCRCGAVHDYEYQNELLIQCKNETCLQWSHLSCQEGLEGQANHPEKIAFKCHHCVRQIPALYVSLIRSCPTHISFQGLGFSRKRAWEYNDH